MTICQTPRRGNQLSKEQTGHKVKNHKKVPLHYGWRKGIVLMAREKIKHFTETAKPH